MTEETATTEKTVWVSLESPIGVRVRVHKASKGRIAIYVKHGWAIVDE